MVEVEPLSIGFFLDDGNQVFQEKLTLHAKIKSTNF